MRTRLTPVGWLLCGALAVLGGCSTLAKLVPGHARTVSLKSLQVVAQPGANLNSATALDLVFVYAANPATVLPKTAPEWFAQKDALQNGLGRAVDVVSLQVPPATVVDKVALPDRHAKALAVYAYANYLAASGQGRSDLSGFRQPTVWLRPTRVTVTDP